MREHLATEIVDKATWQRAVDTLRAHKVVLPTFEELARPSSIPEPNWAGVSKVDPGAADPANLFRVHWYNTPKGDARTSHPAYLELPPELTGVRARILVMLGKWFPMISAHKVLAAYACLVPRLVTGQFDPTRHRAVWPSTGNYCRGGVAISRILGCHGVAVLPEGMSRERFNWLEQWVSDPGDIVRTYGTESNVREIYDKCHELAAAPDTRIINQFSEFANYVGHYTVTGQALADVFRTVAGGDESLRLSAFVAATGSAGTLGAGDYLKREYGTRIAAVEPLECPTLLKNGYGEHNIQGIGDKHVPLIHNLMNTDFVVGVSDGGSDELNVLFNTETGRQYLAQRRQLPRALVDGLGAFGLSGIANVLAAIKLARRMDMDENDAIVTIATDGAELYESEREKTLNTRFAEGFDDVSAGEVFGSRVLGLADDNVMELSHLDRQRMFNLGYYTWVEQQGTSLDDFEVRKNQAFWQGLTQLVPAWDNLIRQMNEEVGVRAGANA
jgi:cysteine synthase